MPDFNRYITGSEVISRTMKVLGLPVPASASGSSESNAKQMWALLTECGQDLWEDYDWQILNKTYNFNVIAPTLTYPMPSDFQNFSDSTAWNMSSMLPMIGPLTPQLWAELKVRNLGGTTVALEYQIANGFIEFYYVPTVSTPIYMDYQSRAWVQDGSAPTTYRDYVLNDADIILFAPRLIITKLILEWRNRKGFDTSADQIAFDKALESAKYDDRPKNDLSTSNQRRGFFLDYNNIPDTGYGR